VDCCSDHNESADDVKALFDALYEEASIALPAHSPLRAAIVLTCIDLYSVDFRLPQLGMQVGQRYMADVASEPRRGGGLGSTEKGGGGSAATSTSVVGNTIVALFGSSSQPQPEAEQLNLLLGLIKLCMMNLQAAYPAGQPIGTSTVTAPSALAALTSPASGSYPSTPGGGPISFAAALGELNLGPGAAIST
jgi:hypothetical protein